MEMPGRQFNSTTYTYSFNGKRDDKDAEYGWQDYGMREYDRRRGQFINGDILAAKYPMLSPYQFASNSPIGGIDQDGLEFSNAFSAIKRGVLGRTKLQLNNLKDGFGDVQQQNYRLRLISPANSVKSLYTKIATDINSIYGTEEGSFKFSDQQIKGSITRGDLIQINPGKKAFDFLVKVTNVQQYDNEHKKEGVDPPHQGFSATFRTLQGHVEVGVITFTALQFKDSKTGAVSFEFDIFSTTRIDHGMGSALNAATNVVRDAQQAVWHQVLQNVSDYMGGKVDEAHQTIYKFKYTEFNDKDNQGSTLGTPSDTASPEIEEKKIDIKPKKKS